MTRVTWTRQAVENVEAIKAYVARDSEVIEVITVHHTARLFRV